MGVACVCLLLGLAAVWYWLPSSSSVSIPGGDGTSYNGTNAVVTDVDIAPDYWTNNSSDTSYLTTPLCYPVAQSGCPPEGGYIITPDCPEGGCANVTPGHDFQYNLTLIVNDTVAHTILGINVPYPFTLRGVVPTLPYTMDPGLPATTFSLLIQSPAAPGEYDLNGVVNTS